MSTSQQKPAAPPQAFQYGQVISVPMSRAGGIIYQDFYCIDVDTTKAIKKLAKHISLPAWDKNATSWGRVKPGNVLIACYPYGWVAYRRMTRAYCSSKTLAHQLCDLPILFPTPETAQAAVELCYPNPHVELGWMWWTGSHFV